MFDSKFIVDFKRKLLRSDGFFRVYDNMRKFDLTVLINDRRRNREIKNNIKGKTSPFVVEFNNAKFWIDPAANQDLHMYDGILGSGYEPMTTKLILENLTLGDTFIDVGANNGYFTVLSSKKVGDHGSVYAFEPSRSTYNRLSRNLELNGCKNVSAHNLAISNNKGQTKFFEFPDRDGGNSLLPLEGTRETTVEVTTLDEICHEARAAIIKVDVEGYEREVLEGGQHVIFDNGASLILEYNRHVLLKKKENFDDLLNLLKKEGYTIRMVDDLGMKIGNSDIRDHHDLHPFGCNIFCTKIN